MSDWPDFVKVFLYACLPAAGNLTGAVMAELTRPPRWLIGAALHGAAGIAIAVIGFELLPRSMDALARPVLTACVLAGGLLAYLLSRAVKAVEGEGGRAAAWMVYLAISIDLLSDGLVTGAGSAAALSLGLLLSAAQFVANLPGGFAAGANMRRRGSARTTRLIASVLVSLPIFITAAVGFFLLRGSGDTIKAGGLALIAGLLLLATIEDMVPEGDAPRPPRWSSSLSFCIGFALIALMTG